MIARKRYDMLDKRHTEWQISTLIREYTRGRRELRLDKIITLDV